MAEAYGQAAAISTTHHQSVGGRDNIPAPRTTGRRIKELDEAIVTNDELTGFARFP
jgi:hypothetical protein